MLKDSSQQSRMLAKTNLLRIKVLIAFSLHFIFLVLIVSNWVQAIFAALISILLIGFVIQLFSQLKQVTQDFKKTDDQMQFIFKSVPIGLHLSYHREEANDSIAESRLFNPAHSNITGLTKTEMDSPGSFEKITHPDDLEKQNKVREELVQGGMKEVSLEKRYLRKDGSVVWVNASWKREYDADGKGFKEISAIVDITESKKANELIRRKEAQLRVIFDSVPIGLLWSDVEIGENIDNRRFIERIVNPAHYTLTGMTKDTAKYPGSFDQISYPEDLAIQKQGISDTIDKGDGSFSMDKRYVHPDGKVVWVSITWLRHWDESMRRYQEISTLVDITEQKEFAEKLKHAKEMAENASRSKSEFLATMSHEIRTPMNGMIGMLHILESQLDKDSKKYLKIAQNSANELLFLINDILDYSKIEAGKMEFENQLFPVDQFLEESSEIHANNAFEKGINYRCCIAPSAAVEISADPHKLRQVISNLISNALKFTESGEVVLGACRISIGDPEDTLEIYVKDTGLGMSSEAKERLFQAFIQEDVSTTRKYGGTGLGLSICKSIVESMGARIGVDTQKGKGSRFWIHIPCRKQERLKELTSPALATVPKKILIVDTCKDTCSYMKTWFLQWNCFVTVFDTISDVESMLSENLENYFDFVFIDFASFSAAEKHWKEILRPDELKRDLKVVVVEKLSESQIREVPNWVDYQLTKPLRLRQLLSVLYPDVEAEEISVLNATQLDESLKATDTSETSNTSVLVVDDNITNQMIVTKLLSLKYGIIADAADDGISAINMLKEKSYDIVLMDCMMPEMDGYGATREIRKGAAGEDNRNIPIIALTANAMEDDKRVCIEAGMDDHLSKPIIPQQLNEKLEKWKDKLSS